MPTSKERLDNRARDHLKIYFDRRERIEAIRPFGETWLLTVENASTTLSLNMKVLQAWRTRGWVDFAEERFPISRERHGPVARLEIWLEDLGAKELKKSKPVSF